jgi:RND family efflux transporter MFP subunit
MNHRFLAVALIALAVSLPLLGAVRGASESGSPPLREVAMPVKVMTLKARTASETPEFPGRVEAGDSALLAFRVAGQLQDLKVRMGDRVEAGTVLAELDPTDYRLNVEARQAEYDLAKLEAERAATLFSQQLISEDQHDTAQTNLTTSRARLEQAREQLSFCKLTAPFAGAIAFTYAMPSEVVTPQQPVLNLQDISTLEIQFNLPPRFQPLLEAGDGAQFTATFNLLPGVPLEARYKEGSMRPDPDTNSYPLTLEVDSPADFSARPGMPVTVRLHHPGLVSSRWVLPKESMFERSGQSAHVWRIDTSDMTVKRVAVTVDDEGVVLAGLKAGDQVVAAGVDRLREGQPVRPWVREGGL